jgi:hypothetical protein
MHVKTPDPMSLERASFSYRYTAAEKLLLLFPCLRQRIKPRRNLLAGPYAGEFGYELMQWQGFIRARRQYYEQVHVITFPGRDYLYEGCHVHAHEIDLKHAGYWYGHLSRKQARQMAHAKAAETGLRDYDIFDTSLLCTRYHKAIFWRQEFRVLREPPLRSKPYDLVFHFRAVRKTGPDPLKNYPPALADELFRLCAERGLATACVGHPDYAYCPTGCADHRSVDLRQTVAAISSAHLGVGEASGGMHLINACGKPTLIWGEGQWRVDPALRWNPFRVPIYVVTNQAWQPQPKEILAAVVQSLEDIRHKTDNFVRPPYVLPAQKIANF